MSGLVVKKLGEGLGWFVVQETTDLPVHQLGFQTQQTGAAFREVLTDGRFGDVDWTDPQLGNNPELGRSIMHLRMEWILKCVDGARPGRG